VLSHDKIIIGPVISNACIILFTGFWFRVDQRIARLGTIAHNKIKVVVNEWVKADINGGGPEFSMKNYNGDILIRKK
jgi:hypothetical protein